MKTTYAETSLHEAAWNEWLTFCVKYRDLPANTQVRVAAMHGPTRWQVPCPTDVLS